MSLINIGSLTAFNAFLSVSVSALMATYMISIGSIMYRRVTGPPLPLSRWRLIGRNVGHERSSGGLGSYGVVINAVALVYRYVLDSEYSIWEC